jgi:hypothetical protein
MIRKTHALMLLLCLPFFSPAQDHLPGIRNTGYLGAVQSLDTGSGRAAAKVRLIKRLTLVDLYPGFAAVRQQYVFSPLDSTSGPFSLGIPVEGNLGMPGIGRLFFTSPDALRFRSGNDSIRADTLAVRIDPIVVDGTTLTLREEFTQWLRWDARIPQGNTTILTVHALVRTSLSRFLRGNEARDGNALAIELAGSGDMADSSLQDEVLVRMKEGLNLTNVWGIRPAGKVTGDLTHLRYVHTGRLPDSMKTLLIWYQGAPPDFKYSKKILPFADTLYTMVDAMPVDDFGSPGFKAIDRDNFSLAPDGLTFSGVLYFLLFTVPWIILLGLVVFLLRGKKKKRESSSIDTLPQ